jgi:hypothetical protein
MLERWRWRYQDPIGGQWCETTARMSAAEAGQYPRARPIPGTLHFDDGDGKSHDPLPNAIGKGMSGAGPHESESAQPAARRKPRARRH